MIASKFLRRVRAAATLAFIPVLAGCASFSGDAGMGWVEKITRDKLGADVTLARPADPNGATARRIDELLSKPLSADDAVQIALLNNRGLQADFAELGFAEATMVAAGRPPNIGISLLRTSGGGEIDIERGLHIDLVRLLSLPLVAGVEARRFEMAKSNAAVSAIRLANETRRAWIQAVAAEEVLRYQKKVSEVAEASAELARRMATVGNWSRLQQAREQGYYADAALNLARADQARARSREALIRLLGVWGTQTAFTLPTRLPDLPKAPEEQPDIEQRAMQSRLDVIGARLSAESMAGNLGLSKATRFINVLDFGVRRDSASGMPDKRGYEISLELPLFDWGTSRIAMAEALYMQSVSHAAEVAINARSQVRESYQAYRSEYDIARHYRDEVVPVRKRIAEENMLRYNGMLIGVFDLLADARAQIGSVNSYIEALRDFWLAESDLRMAMVGTPSAATLPRGARAALAVDAAGGH